jgi:Predicted transcriptional regulators
VGYKKGIVTVMKKKTRYVILGLLRDEAMTGYELKNIIDLRMSFFWQESFGQIYPELNAMVQDGLLENKDSPKSDNRGKIKYFITEKGRQIFNDWMSEEYEKDTVRCEALLKFFLADDNNKMDVIRHLEKYNLKSRETLELFQSYQDALSEIKDVHNHKYMLRMLDLGIRQQELICDWCQSYLLDLKHNNEV